MLFSKMSFPKIKFLAPAFVLMALAATASAQTSGPVSPPPATYTQTFNFPPAGLAGTETLQVNVVNVATAPPNVTATASCTGTITFAAANGSPVTTNTPQKFTLGTGQVYSASLTLSQTTYSSRGEIRAIVQQTITLPTLSACTLSMSLEIFDTSTGVTHAIMSGPAPSPIPLYGVLSGVAPVTR